MRNYAAIHRTKPAIDHFSKIYAKFSLKRTVNAWKEKLKKDFLSLARKKARPNLVDDEMLQKIRDVIIGSCLAGKLISRKMVIAIQAGVIKANKPEISKEEVISPLKVGLEML